MYELLDKLFLQTYDFTAEDLKDLGEIGRGAFGTVNKMIHKTSGTIMAVKVLLLLLLLLFSYYKCVLATVFSPIPISTYGKFYFDNYSL